MFYNKGEWKMDILALKAYSMNGLLAGVWSTGKGATAMDIMKEYQRWLEQELEDAALTGELQAIQGQEGEISDRFYTDLEFGTAGLRGVLGAGINRMNIYTVRRATQAYADVLKARFQQPTAASRAAMQRRPIQTPFLEVFFITVRLLTLCR